MASASSGNTQDKREERRKQVMIGELPSDFLRVTPISQEQQLDLDEQAALALQQQLAGNFAPANVSGRLSISIIEAKLTKNYGMTRMDPYVRLRIGQTVYETPTDYNGAKNPRWNKVFHCFLFPTVGSIYIEIFDECAFTLDEKIAWAHYTIPEAVYQGETLDEWVPLTGRQGEEKEGFINLVLSYTPIPAGTMVYPAQQMVALMPAPFYGVMPTTVPYCAPVYHPRYGNQAPACGVPAQPAPTQQQQQQQPVQVTEDDIKQVKEMFPDIEDDVIKTVLESNGGNKDRSVNALLAMSADS